MSDPPRPVYIHPTPLGDVVTLAPMSRQAWARLAIWIIAEKLAGGE